MRSPYSASWRQRASRPGTAVFRNFDKKFFLVAAVGYFLVICAESVFWLWAWLATLLRWTVIFNARSASYGSHRPHFERYYKRFYPISSPSPTVIRPLSLIYRISRPRDCIDSLTWSRCIS